MNRNFHKFRVSSVNPTPRWRSVFVALVLALAIGSAGESLPVQAAPAGDTEIEFIFISLQTLRPVCVGEKKEINVYLHRRLDYVRFDAPDNTITRQPVPGISIKAAMVDGPIIGKISPAKKATDWNGSAVFVFLAENPGESIITFEATVVTPGWFGTNVAGDTISGIIHHPIKVINCKYEVTTTQQSVLYGAFNFNMVAMIDKAVITGDEQGHFTGTTPVNWVGATSRDMGICLVSIDVAPTSQAEFTGDMDESGQLMLNLSYQAPEHSITATCEGLTRTDPVQLNGEPLEFIVPSSGGVLRLSQGLEWDNLPTPGFALVVVVPVEDEGIAFIPTEQEARVGPLFPGWAMQWDNFISLFGVLLALH